MGARPMHSGRRGRRPLVRGIRHSRIELTFATDNPFGVLDHDVHVPTGEVVSNPVRVVAHDDGSALPTGSIRTGGGGLSGRCQVPPKSRGRITLGVLVRKEVDVERTGGGSRL